jgi:hypothetical protein
MPSTTITPPAIGKIGSPPPPSTAVPPAPTGARLLLLEASGRWHFGQRT